MRCYGAISPLGVCADREKRAVLTCRLCLRSKLIRRVAKETVIVSKFRIRVCLDQRNLPNRTVYPSKV